MKCKYCGNKFSKKQSRNRHELYRCKKKPIKNFTFKPRIIFKKNEKIIGNEYGRFKDGYENDDIKNRRIIEYYIGDNELDYYFEKYYLHDRNIELYNYQFKKIKIIENGKWTKLDKKLSEIALTKMIKQIHKLFNVGVLIYNIPKIPINQIIKLLKRKKYY